MTDRVDLLSRLAKEPESSHLRELLHLLSDRETRVVAGRSSVVSVSETSRLWSTRLKNRDLTGKELDGAETLLLRLKGLAQQRKLEQFALLGSGLAANVFFEHSKPHAFIGSVLFKTSDKPREVVQESTETHSVEIAV